MGSQPERHTRTVRWWKEEKGYGESPAMTGEIYFVHFSDIVADKPGYRAMPEGQRVEFEWRGARAANNRKHANNVRMI